jgi:hypothetical protein
MPFAFFFCPVGNMARPGFTCLEKAGIPLFFQPARCLSAIGNFGRYGIERENRG